MQELELLIQFGAIAIVCSCSIWIGLAMFSLTKLDQEFSSAREQLTHQFNKQYL